MSKIKYSDEDLLNILKNFYLANGRANIGDFSSKNNLPSSNTYINRFGSWNNAKKIVKIPIREMTGIKMSKQDLRKKFIKIANKLGHTPTLRELENQQEFPTIKMIYKYFENYSLFIDYCKIKNNFNKNGMYKKDFLVNEIKRFVNEFNRIPISVDFDKPIGFPSRKVFTKHFGSFNQALIEAGFIPTKLDEKEYNKKYRNKEYLSGLILNYILKYNTIPKLKQIITEYNNHSLKLLYIQVYGSWNNALKELDLPYNSVSQYDNDFLEKEFHRFVKENNRVPCISDFNNSGYPSFWCYQNRFGSWNNAVISYGYEINDSNRKYTLANGEICSSSYEFDISNWLNERHIIYERNIKYKDFIDNYKGKMDCDYRIIYNDKIWYVEMAGFIGNRKYEKLSESEKKYLYKLLYKKKLLRRQQLQYLIIYPDDIKNKSLNEIFYFID